MSRRSVRDIRHKYGCLTTFLHDWKIFLYFWLIFQFFFLHLNKSLFVPLAVERLILTGLTENMHVQSSEWLPLCNHHGCATIRRGALVVVSIHCWLPGCVAAADDLSTRRPNRCYRRRCTHSRRQIVFCFRKRSHLNKGSLQKAADGSFCRRLCTSWFSSMRPLHFFPVRQSGSDRPSISQ